MFRNIMENWNLSSHVISTEKKQIITMYAGMSYPNKAAPLQ